MGWKSTVRLKHLFTDEEDHASVQASMKAVADVLSKEVAFARFNQDILTKFRKIPKDNEWFTPIECANKLLTTVYDYADYNRIWIE